MTSLRGVLGPRSPTDRARSVVPDLAAKVRVHALEQAFRALFRPSLAIEVARIGTDYGGWWVPPALIEQSSICYLAGVGTDISFDLGLIDRFGCGVWGIDPTPRTVEWIAGQDLDARYTFVPVGLAGASGKLRFYSPRNPDDVSHSIKNLQQTSTYFEAEVLSVRGLMRRLGHDHLDVLKLDVEGAEHDVVRSMLDDGIHPRVLCLEFDQPEPLSLARATVSALLAAGYGIVKVDMFNVTFVRL